MKRLLPLFCIVLMLPFVLCSCFESEIEKISLSVDDVVITAGETYTLTFSVEPEDAEVKKLTWTESDKSIITVNDGVIKGISAGNAFVTLKSENGIQKICNVTVKAKEAESITLSTTSTSVRVGNKIQLAAKIQPADAPVKVDWTSKNTKIATVDSEGFVRGISEGTTDIVCKTSNGKEAICSITVKPHPSTSSSTDPIEKKTEPTTEPKETQPATSASNSSKEFIFPDSSVRKLSESEAKSLSPSKAQDAINEIFARNGYIFKSSELQSYYQSRSWYKPNPSFSMSDFNSIEDYNIALLSKYR